MLFMTGNLDFKKVILLLSTHAVNYAINKIISEIETKNRVIETHVDLSKAFDTIDHHKLLIKLEHYGIRRICHDLLKNY